MAGGITPSLENTAVEPLLFLFLSLLPPLVPKINSINKCILRIFKSLADECYVEYYNLKFIDP